MTKATDAQFNLDVRRFDDSNIISSNRHLASVFGTLLAYDAAGYEPGQVLAKNSVSGLHQKYNPSGASGLDTAVAVLLDHAEAEDFPSSGESLAARGLYAGEVYKAKLSVLDAGAITDLKARTITLADGTEILKF